MGVIAAGILVVGICLASVRVSGVVFVAPEGWHALPVARRRAIRSAVARGRATDGDAAEAWIAATLASGSLAAWGVSRRLGVPLAVLIGALLLGGVALNRGDSGTALAALALGLLELAALGLNARRHARLRDALAANLSRASHHD